MHRLYSDLEKDREPVHSLRPTLMQIGSHDVGHPNHLLSAELFEAGGLSFLEVRRFAGIFPQIEKELTATGVSQVLPTVLDQSVLRVVVAVLVVEMKTLAGWRIRVFDGGEEAYAIDGMVGWKLCSGELEDGGEEIHAGGELGTLLSRGKLAAPIHDQR